MLQSLQHIDVERRSILNFLILNSHFELTFGLHYPKDVIIFINKLFITISELKLGCGFHHSMALTYSNELYVWGSNEFGQLGLDDTVNRNSPQKINITNVKQFSCGSYHSMILTYSGKIYVWGNNDCGQLGLGDFLNRSTPQKLSGADLPKFKQIVCQDNCSLAITETNEIYVWGYNNNGQLGLGDRDNRNTPHKLNFDHSVDVKEIICGDKCSIALTYSNEVYVWGNNRNGQLGLGDYNDRYTPHKLIFPAEREKIKQIVRGDYHSMAITNSNEVFIWGYNRYGQSGFGFTIEQNTPQKLNVPNIKQIFSGFFYSMVLTSTEWSKDLYGWGYSRDIALSISDYYNRIISQEPVLRNVKEIVCGGMHLMVLTESNEVYVWGENDKGQLGLGDNDNRNVPTKLEF